MTWYAASTRRRWTAGSNRRSPRWPRRRRTVIGDAREDYVRLIVTDDGRGGARLDGAGSGLRGLAERIRTMDGQLTVDSPVGGPTTVTVQLPTNKPGEGN